MNIKSLIYPLVASFTLMACGQKIGEYEYIYNSDLRIKLFEFENKDDFFMIRVRHDGQIIDYGLLGDFDKDSVDVAVENYFEDGTFPTLDDLR